MTPTPGRRRLPLRGAVGVLLVAVLGACPAPRGEVDLGEHHDLVLLRSTLVSASDVVVVPGVGWATTRGHGPWSFQGEGRLMVHVSRTPARPLVVELVPDAGTARLHFQALWDERPLFPGSSCPDPRGSRLEIGPDRLGPGVHHLVLRRAARDDAPGDREVGDNVFSRLAYGTGTPLRLIAPEEADRHRLIARLLRFSVTGTGPLRRSGCLLDGPLRAGAWLVVESDTDLSWRVENLSDRPARFTAAVDGAETGVTVAPRASAPVAVRLPAGRRRLRLEASGASRGLYLWGSLHARVPHPELPPVVLLTLDTTRRDGLGPYGRTGATPALEALAATSTVFDHAVATSPWTLPSHGSIFTGLYPSQHGGGVTSDGLPPAATTMAELLRDRGYFTVGLAGGELCSSRWGLARGFSLYRDPDGVETRADALTDAVEALLPEVAGRPLFLFVNYFDPHAIYRAPAEYEALFDVDRLRAPLRRLAGWRELVDDGDYRAWAAIIDGRTPAPPEAVEYVRAAYRAEVAFMDAEIGRLLRLLDDRGLLDPALVVAVGDHGELLGEGGFFSHACRLDPELIEVPLLVKWPGQRAGTRSGALVSQVDLLRLVMAAAGSAGGGGGHPDVGRPFTGSGEEAGVVFMEEHETWFHPLFPRMRVAPDVWGAQGLDRREVLWHGGGECARRGPDGWVAAPCPEPPEVRLEHLLQRLGSPTDHARPGEGVLEAGDADRLRALGYLP